MAQKYTGKHYHFQDLEWWPEGGLIYILDHRDETFNAVTVRDALERAAALTVERRKMTAKIISSVHSNGNKVLVEERNKLQVAIEGLIEATRKAKAQGDPSDPEVLEQMRRSRSVNNIIVPENPAPWSVDVAD